MIKIFVALFVILSTVGCGPRPSASESEYQAPGTPSFDLREADEQNGKYNCLMRGPNGYYSYSGDSSGYRVGISAGLGRRLESRNSKIVYVKDYTEKVFENLNDGDIVCRER